jgi:hypothetical protein
MRDAAPVATSDIAVASQHPTPAVLALSLVITCTEPPYLICIACATMGEKYGRMYL